MSRRRGLNLVEVVISTILVGVVSVASMNSVGGVLQIWWVSEARRSGEGLAQQLMTEILQQAYKEPDDSPLFGVESPESLSDRSSWDDVDDYHGWSSIPEDKNGNTLTGYSGWTRAVTVNYVDIGDPTLASGSDQGLKRITILVTDSTGLQTTLVAYRSQWGVLEQTPAADTTVLTWVGNELQIDTTPTQLQSGVGLLNHAEDSGP